MRHAGPDRRRGVCHPPGLRRGAGGKGQQAHLPGDRGASGQKQGSNVTASIGVATRVPAPAEGPEVLFQAADKNLYSAKAAGRNCVIAG
ncbi:MAG: hypothetical protein DSZ02_00440 [Gammaproteobacteria bacterium]|nr:MAG: hypothetical protein DSZ02_00440 [Gammaproteobacteria bacterium]